MAFFHVCVLLSPQGEHWVVIVAYTVFLLNRIGSLNANWDCEWDLLYVLLIGSDIIALLSNFFFLLLFVQIHRGIGSSFLILIFMNWDINFLNSRKNWACWKMWPCDHFFVVYEYANLYLLCMCKLIKKKQNNNNNSKSNFLVLMVDTTVISLY